MADEKTDNFWGKVIPATLLLGSAAVVGVVLFSSPEALHNLLPQHSDLVPDTNVSGATALALANSSPASPTVA